MGLRRFLTYMDNSGKLAGYDTLDSPSKYRRYYFSSYLFYPAELGYDTAVSMVHSFKNKGLQGTDTLDMNVEFFDADMNLLFRHNITDDIAPMKEYQIITARDAGYFLLLGLDYDEHLQFARQRVYLFDIYGNKLEEYLFPSLSNGMEGSLIMACKLKHEPGFIMATQQIHPDSGAYLMFYKSNGLGIMSRLKRIKLKEFHAMSVPLLYQFDNGDILLAGTSKDVSLPVGMQSKTYRWITCRWDADSLGLKRPSTAVRDHSNEGQYVVFPNPTDGQVKVRSEKEYIAQIRIFDLNGRVLKNFQVSGRNISVDLSDLPQGHYSISLYDDLGILIKAGPLIKL